MIKKTKQELLETAQKLKSEGYKNLYATNDGYFFTNPDMAANHSKGIESEVFRFTDEDFVSAAESSTEIIPEPEPVEKSEPAPAETPQPVKESKGHKSKNK